ncbi:uncharacterized protein LOC107022102 [Solanum pennellii]|uniref:Uncharacterized protein LOC107022102 n=1 Tax=Solanum pennellii TaxID=28526 RepID=A0ABM1GZS5_SOLPN|nr:uncharacterized protein LOC107022102 [Solanum pennellii]
MNGLTLARKILQVDYFWMTTENDSCKFVQKCRKCQVHGDLIRVPPHELNAMSSPWPFVAWGMEVIGPIEPAAPNGHRFILVAIDYFTKWVEATSYKSVTKKVVDDFVRNNLICRTSTGATPYLLGYGTEAVIPAEVEIPSLRIIQEAKFSNAEWDSKRIDQLTLIDENRMVAVCHGQLYQQRMISAFHKRVRARFFKVGQLVLKRIFPHQAEYKGKFAPNWQGPYMVRKALSGGALDLLEMDCTAWPKPINSDAVKRYYV